MRAVVCLSFSGQVSGLLLSSFSSTSCLVLFLGHKRTIYDQAWYLAIWSLKTFNLRSKTVFKMQKKTKVKSVCCVLIFPSSSPVSEFLFTLWSRLAWVNWQYFRYILKLHLLYWIPIMSNRCFFTLAYKRWYSTWLFSARRPHETYIFHLLHPDLPLPEGCCAKEVKIGKMAESSVGLKVGVGDKWVKSQTVRWTLPGLFNG